MKHKTSLLVFAALCAATAQSGTIARYAWQVETRAPVSQTLQVYRGETVDLECRYTSYMRPMDTTGAVVVLHCRTNGMAAGYSFQATGTVGRAGASADAAQGWVYVRLLPGTHLPASPDVFTYTLDVANAGARLLRASGTLRVSGTSAGSLALPTPATADPLGSAAAVSNAFVAAIAAERTARINGDRDGTNYTDLAVSRATNSTVFRATSATRLVSPDGSGWLTVAGGTATVWQVATPRAEGSALRIVSASGDWNGTLSAVGDLLAWGYADYWEHPGTFLSASGGGGSWVLTRPGVYPEGMQVSWQRIGASPDGAYVPQSVDAHGTCTLAFASTTNSFVVQMDGGTP